MKLLFMVLGLGIAAGRLNLPDLTLGTDDSYLRTSGGINQEAMALGSPENLWHPNDCPHEKKVHKIDGFETRRDFCTISFDLLTLGSCT